MMMRGVADMAQQHSDLDVLVTGGVLGALGYALGRGKLEPWKEWIKLFNENISLLSQYRIVKPVGFLRGSTEAVSTLYSEAAWGFVFGLFNASVISSVRCLESGLQVKYTLTTANPALKRLKELIDWAEQTVSLAPDVAHALRILRNRVHGTQLVEREDAAEVLRHVSGILGFLYPADRLTVLGYCRSCRKRFSNEYHADVVVLFSRLDIVCPGCNQIMGSNQVMP